MSQLHIHLIPINTAEQVSLKSELRSHQIFFAIFGGTFLLASLLSFVFIPFATLIRYSVTGIFFAFFAGFLVLYISQARRISRNLNDGRSLLYSGIITHKEEGLGEDGQFHRLWIGDRAFEVAPFVFSDVNTGQFLAVREWHGSGDYIEHTTDQGYAATLMQRGSEQSAGDKI